MMTTQEVLNNTDIFLLDMDGTIYLSETPIGEVKETLSRLRDQGKRLVYCTNNSSKTPEEYEKKLQKIGLWDGRDMVYTSAIATAEYLNRHHAGAKVYALATKEVQADFAARGISLTEENPDICVLAYDVTLTFEKLKKFNEFLAGGCFYVATHPDAVCPTSGVSMPDVGSLIRLFECSSGRTPDVICGKPYTVMGESLTALLGADHSRVAMVGDRLHTDIRFANNNAFTAVLVLSGETTEDMIARSPDKPDAVLSSVNDFLPYLR